ncbi:translation initiation factor IF-2-like [Cebus imitator]|uniref:translation initiation factor IF-2-like n=1 Tax=Cebus imitator TaxID=2715852 RepID=UPI00189A5B24|nr:translation initiation factor IF-2-like [Cebus imitator]
MPFHQFFPCLCPVYGPMAKSQTEGGKGLSSDRREAAITSFRREPSPFSTGLPGPPGSPRPTDRPEVRSDGTNGEAATSDPAAPKQTTQAVLARREQRGRPAGPSPRYAGRAASPRRPPSAVRRPERHRSSPETLGRTPPPPAVSPLPSPAPRAACAAPGPARRSPDLTGRARPRAPPAAAAAAAAATASALRLRENRTNSPAAAAAAAAAASALTSPRTLRARPRTTAASRCARSAPVPGANKLRKDRGCENIEICEYLLAPNFAPLAIMQKMIRNGKKNRKVSRAG